MANGAANLLLGPTVDRHHRRGGLLGGHEAPLDHGVEGPVRHTVHGLGAKMACGVLDAELEEHPPTPSKLSSSVREEALPIPGGNVRPGCLSRP